MIKIKDKKMCCGCHACYSICPKKAIQMEEDEFGFLYPNINKDICVDCGLCEKVCPILHKNNIKTFSKAYACINKNEKIRLQSSSGGIFSLLADKIINDGGVVFGAAFDKKFYLRHTYVSNKEDIYIFRTSKYIQSDIGDSFCKAKEILNKGKKVLFTGTPCQIEGLLCYLGKEYDNLYTQDIICHGVPSPLVWRKYLDYRRKKDKKVPNDVKFRNKDNGWKKYNLKFTYDDKIYKKNQSEDLYMRSFLNNLSLRDSCYECNFKKYDRLSDITLGDFWGIENIDSNFDDNKGTSLVIIHSNKGEELINSIKENILIKSIDLNEAIKYNASYIKSTKKDEKRRDFFRELDNVRFDKLIDKYCVKTNLLKKFLRRLKTILKK